MIRVRMNKKRNDYDNVYDKTASYSYEPERASFAVESLMTSPVGSFGIIK